jgi:hypothetical protein
MSGVGECHLGSGFKSLIWLLLYYDCLVFLSELMGSYWPLVSAAHSRSYFFFFYFYNFNIVLLRAAQLRFLHVFKLKDSSVMKKLT